MLVKIEYIPYCEIGKRRYPDVAEEVYVPDHWTDYYISQWWVDRHPNIHGSRIKVLKIIHKDLTTGEEFVKL